MSRVLKSKILKKKANLAVIGLGYVGLPLAVNFAKAGFRVYGLDKDHDRVQRLKRKQSYILDVPAKDVSRVISRGKLVPSTEFDILKKTDVVIICVPTPIKKRYTPDISYIVSAVRTVVRYLKKDSLVVLESTTYPGTTEELIKPELEAGGLKAGKDFYLSFSPERIDPGNKKYSVATIPKVVGGYTKTCTVLTQLVYQKIIKQVHPVTSTQAAEMTKLLENSFRIINIGWINEVAMMCHKLGIDVWEVIDAAKTKPFGFMPFYPGLGVGGHCIPEDPLYLYWKAKHLGFSSKYIKLSADTNANMPSYAVSRVKEILDRESLSGMKILVLGVTYKKDVKDLRKSPPLKLLELFKKERCSVDYYDPIIPFLALLGIHMKSIKLTPARIKKYDCVIIATDHTRVNYGMVLKNAKLVFDTRNIYSGVKNRKLFKL